MVLYIYLTYWRYQSQLSSRWSQFAVFAVLRYAVHLLQAVIKLLSAPSIYDMAPMDGWFFFFGFNFDESIYQVFDATRVHTALDKFLSSQAQRI